MTTTEVEVAPRTGDPVTASSPPLALSAGISILLALAGVFVFLMIEGIPGLTQDSRFYGPAPHLPRLRLAAALRDDPRAGIAVVIAAPLSFGIALVISHYAPKSIAVPAAYVVDLLAAVPSVVFGLWGINVLAGKLVPGYEWAFEHLNWLPFFEGPASNTGRTILTAGIVLAIMILPIITAISVRSSPRPRGSTRRPRWHSAPPAGR